MRGIISKQGHSLHCLVFCQMIILPVFSPWFKAKGATTERCEAVTATGLQGWRKETRYGNGFKSDLKRTEFRGFPIENQKEGLEA